VDEKQRELLGALAVRFTLRPWNDPIARLAELRDRYLSLSRYRDAWYELMELPRP
jgi:hypothetical protein